MAEEESELSWLRRLVNNSLLQYTEPEIVSSLNKDKEREILIVLSEFLKKIKLRVQHVNANVHTETGISPSHKYECPSRSKTHDEVDQSLLEIVSSLMFFLNVKRQFIQHVAGSAIVSVSEFVYTTGNFWEDLVHLLFNGLELSIGKLLHSSASSSGSDCFHHDLSKVKVSLINKLENCDWDTVAAICQVLRCIFKYLMEDCDTNFTLVYFDLFSSSLSSVPWDLVEEYGICEEAKIKFLGTFIQLLCSVVDKNKFLEGRDDSFCGYPLHRKIINLIPRLVKWCLDKQENFNNICMVQYLRHKLLVLMVKISYHISSDHLVLLSWLQLINNYFQEYLQCSISLLESCRDDCLDSSPFLSSLYDEVHNVRFRCSSHIKRLTIFLFLKCCFNLIFPKGNDEKCSLCLTVPVITSEGIRNLSCSCREKGLQNLYSWLGLQLPHDTFLKQNLYFERCRNFSTSFIQLYLEEDDLLFEVLLQSLSIPPSMENKTFKGEAAFQDLHNNAACVPDIFNPLYLFHSFLSGILYDHQVLLDYLISKDTGLRCAEYLLRCLRLVCDSWSEFLEIFACGSCKKRKMLMHDLKLGEDIVPSAMDDDGSPRNHCEQEYEYRSKELKELPFEEAKRCLLSLKASVENLNRKNLFPYDPAVLLKRLTRFQEHCCEKENGDGS